MDDLPSRWTTLGGVDEDDVALLIEAVEVSVKDAPVDHLDAQLTVQHASNLGYSRALFLVEGGAHLKGEKKKKTSWFFGSPFHVRAGRKERSALPL